MLMKVVAPVCVCTVECKQAEEAEDYVHEFKQEFEHEQQEDDAAVEHLRSSRLNFFPLIKCVNGFVEDVSSTLAQSVDDAQRRQQVIAACVVEHLENRAIQVVAKYAVDQDVPLFEDVVAGEAVEPDHCAFYAEGKPSEEAQPVSLDFLLDVLAPVNGHSNFYGFDVEVVDIDFLGAFVGAEFLTHHVYVQQIDCYGFVPPSIVDLKVPLKFTLKFENGHDEVAVHDNLHFVEEKCQCGIVADRREGVVHFNLGGILRQIGVLH